jgi:hypothetical protein
MDFWDVGGFDEGFSGQGLEDVELGFRLYARGLPFVLSREAWALKTSRHPAEVANGIDIDRHNALRFLLCHQHPAVELTWALHEAGSRHEVEDEYVKILIWEERCRKLPVSAEIGQATAGLPDGTRVVVLGCGGDLPDTFPAGSSVVDFDSDLLEKAVAGGRHRGANVIGIRTPFADRSADVVVITSRLAGAWRRWHREILTEARRIGRRVHVALPIPDLTPPGRP